MGQDRNVAVCLLIDLLRAAECLSGMLHGSSRLLVCCLVILFAVEHGGRTMGVGRLIVQFSGLLMTFMM